jgi:hypothetical protein
VVERVEDAEHDIECLAEVKRRDVVNRAEGTFSRAIASISGERSMPVNGPMPPSPARIVPVPQPSSRIEPRPQWYRSTNPTIRAIFGSGSSITAS